MLYGARDGILAIPRDNEGFRPKSLCAKHMDMTVGNRGLELLRPTEHVDTSIILAQFLCK